MERSLHRPVLLPEILEYLKCAPSRIYVDGTVGSGGHARAILERSSPTGRLIGLDWDEQAIRRAQENLSDFGKRVELRQKNFKELKSVLESLSLKAVDGILLDLGVSTEQLEDQERGFSFRWDSPLDMRMSRQIKTTAYDLLRKLPAPEIYRILREYGEERWAKRIARAIVHRRQIKPLSTTRELVELVEKSVPYYGGRIHPATRTFQGLRMAVNDELGNLKSFLNQCPGLLFPEGRLCIISFHSLEDRMVKGQFRQWAKGPKDTPLSFRMLTPRPVVPSSEEIFLNPKARSAKLRVVEKLGVNIERGEDGRSDL